MTCEMFSRYEEAADPDPRNRVAQATCAFWIMKILAAMLGEQEQRFPHLVA